MFPTPASSLPCGPTACFLLALILAAPPSSGEIVGFEPFDYPDGGISGRNGGNFWAFDNFAPVTAGTVSDWDNGLGSTVTDGRLVTNNSVADRDYNGAESEGAVNDPASSPSSVLKSVYWRVTVTTGATVPDSFGLASLDFTTPRLFFGKRVGNPRFAVDELGVAASTSTFTPQPDTSYTLVAKLDYVANQIALFVDPDLTGPESAANPVASRGYTGTNWSTSIRLSSSSGGEVTWDNLIVATSWEELDGQGVGTDPVVTTAVDEFDAYPPAGEGLSLREALAYATPGSTVTVAGGVRSSGVVLEKGEILINRPLTLQGGGLTVDGGSNGDLVVDPGESRCFRIRDEEFFSNIDVTLSGLTIRNGTADAGGNIVNNENLTLESCEILDGRAESGGGVLSDDLIVRPSLTIRDCLIQGNQTILFNGGGLLGIESDVTLIDSVFRGNRSETTGGGADIRNSVLDVTRCRFEDNEAEAGGGLRTFSNLATDLAKIEDCDFVGNRAFFSGGGLRISSALEMTNTTVRSNRVIDLGNPAFRLTGGGLAFSGDQIDQTPIERTGILENCTIVGNRVEPFADNPPDPVVEKGGGVMLTGGRLTLNHCTVIGNVAARGGGIAVGDLTFGTTSETIVFASVLRDNEGGDLEKINANPIQTSGSNFVGTGNGTNDLNATGDVIDDSSPIGLSELLSYGGLGPCLMPLPGSPLIDAAAASALTTDQRGEPRSVDGDLDWVAIPDIGAVELDFIEVTTATDELDGSPNQFEGTGTSLREAIVYSTTNQLITFDQGLDNQTIQLKNGSTTLGPLQIEHSLFIDASTLPNGITIDGGSNGDFLIDPGETSCIVIDDGSFSSFARVGLVNLTIQGGVTERGGGNVLSIEQLEMVDCRILDGRMRAGQGIGGGGIATSGASLSMLRCEVAGNRTELFPGGGIYYRGGVLLIKDSTIRDNQSGSRGGGLYVDRSDFEVDGCTFEGNHALSLGSGISALAPGETGSAMLKNCTVTGHSGSSAVTSELEVEVVTEHCTIVDNELIGMQATGGGLFRVRATVVRDNNVSDVVGAGDFESLGGNLVGAGNATADFVGPGDLVDPAVPLFLEPLGNYGGPTLTRRPLISSPLIDGAASSGIVLDQRGQRRASLPDIGAVELQVATEFVPLFDLDPDGDGFVTGIEALLGLNPTDPDAGAEAAPRVSFTEDGKPVFSIGINRTSARYLELIVERSTELGGWDEIYRLTGDIGQVTAPDIDNDLALDRLTLTDFLPVPDGRVFYRLQVDLLAPPP